jgi:UDP-glucuronate decarboxylase
MNTAHDIIEGDLAYMTERLGDTLTPLEGKRLLITGGAGFLGYYLVQLILFHNRDCEQAKLIDLTVWDNYIRGVPAWLEALENESSLTLKKHDITHPLPADMGAFEYIIHAASIASPMYYRKYPIETMDANVHGLRYLLDYCLEQRDTEKPVEGFLFFSTSEIYGDPTPENIPTPETYQGRVSCTGPRACYDESKRYGETLCINFAQQYGLPIKMARPFNNYGPGLKVTDKRVLPDFARNVLNNEDIVMLSDGSPTRTFCYIADAIVGYYRILLHGKSGESYNIGVETPEISMAVLADKVVALGKELYGYDGKAVCRTSEDAEYLTDNPNRRCPVIGKAQQDIGYDPGIQVDEGLRRTMIWYKENKEGSEA